LIECKLKKISPTALKTFESDPDRFVMTYILGSERLPQNEPMAIGSAFDIYVKTALLNESQEYFEDQFQRSVEITHRDWARVEGKRVFDMYAASGALDNLRSEISDSPIRCEFDTTHIIKYPDGSEVPIGGKPDLMYVRDNLGVIVDWKVTGFMSRASPAHGYVKLYKNNYDLGPHKSIMPTQENNMVLGLGANIREDWMTQLTMYSWAALPLDVDRIIGIDQLVFANKAGRYESGGEQELRVAVFRFKVLESYQEDLRNRLRRAWEMIKSGHFYSNKTREESDQRVEFIANADDMTLWALQKENRYGK